MTTRIPLRSFLAGSLFFDLVLSTAYPTTIYTSQTTFLSHIRSGYYLENFDSLPKGLVVPPLTFSENGFSYRASPALFNFFNVGPGSDVWLSTSTSNLSIVFSLTGKKVTAIGGFFFVTAFLGNVTTGTITATLDDGSNFSILNPSATSFIGFTTSTPIQSLVITPTVMPPNTNVFMTANDLIVGSATVPDTTDSALLFGFALAMLFISTAIWQTKQINLES